MLILCCDCFPLPPLVPAENEVEDVAAQLQKNIQISVTKSKEKPARTPSIGRKKKADPISAIASQATNFKVSPAAIAAAPSSSSSSSSTGAKRAGSRRAKAQMDMDD